MRYRKLCKNVLATHTEPKKKKKNFSVYKIIK